MASDEHEQTKAAMKVADIGLRDYFAVAALNGMLACERNGEPHLFYNPPGHTTTGPACAQWAFVIGDAVVWAENAYRIADAMLTVRATPTEAK